MTWHKVLEDKKDLPSGRVKTVLAGHKQIALTHFDGKFSAFAENCGGFGIRVTEKTQLDSAVKKALEYDGPSLVEIIADPDLT